MRVTREGLKEARRQLLLDDGRYQGVGDVRGDLEYTAAGSPKCMAKEDVANLLRTKCEWKVLVTRPVQDKYDNTKLFWTLKADTTPTRRTFTVQTSTHTPNRQLSPSTKKVTTTQHNSNNTTTTTPQHTH